MGAQRAANARGALPTAVPAVGAGFWAVEGLASVLGGTCAHQLDAALGMKGTSAFVGVVLVVVLAARRRSDRYRAPLHWLTVVVMGVAGASLVEDLTEGAAAPPTVSASTLTVALALTFCSWWAAERTLSRQEVTSLPRRLCYWLVVLLTFAWGTAVTDLLHEQIGLGDWSIALLVGVVIPAVAVTRYGLGANTATCFWVIYVLIRALGAALGEASSQARSGGGLGLGAAGTDVALLVLVLVCVTYLALAHRHRVPTVLMIDLTADRTADPSANPTAGRAPDQVARHR